MLRRNNKQNVTKRRLNASLPISPLKMNTFLFQTCCQSSARRGDAITAKFSIIPDKETFGYHRQCYQSCPNEKPLKKFDRENQEEELPQTSTLQRRPDAFCKRTLLLIIGSVFRVFSSLPNCNLQILCKII